MTACIHRVFRRTEGSVRGICNIPGVLADRWKVYGDREFALTSGSYVGWHFVVEITWLVLYDLKN